MALRAALGVIGVLSGHHHYCIEQLDTQYETDPIEVNADGETAGLTDIWIAGIPLRAIPQNTVSRAPAGTLHPY